MSSTPSTSATTPAASKSAAQSADAESPTDVHEFLQTSAVTAEVAQQGVGAETERFTSVQVMT